MAIPKEGYFKLEQGRYGPVFPKTPANYGFTIIAKVKPGREQAIREYGKKIEKAVAENPSVLAPLKLHYLRWVLFNIGGEPYFMYQGFSTLTLTSTPKMPLRFSAASGLNTVFENLEGFPMDWKTNVPAFVKFVRDHHVQAFWNTESIRMSRGRSEESAQSKRARYPPCLTRCSDAEQVHRPRPPNKRDTG